MTSERRDEIEVKIPAPDLGRIREILREKSARLRRERHDEVNDLYDADGRLASSGCALRLRRAGTTALVTFKGPARFENGVKRREERETIVADAKEMEAILAALGFARRFRYEKRREEWELAECVIALDETPIGTFVEVEGDPPSIRRAVAALELDFAAAIPYSYARLYELRRKDDPELPINMVFEASAT